ncbi:hypothetical protein LIER_12011 [Lithospermum erythrorhizon]|uniref:Homeobox domain-containing protein n=1 Tax=Lithospermum erythrorhizon TaxID=34254 RepID=A0AAV3PQN1_LITER
MVVKYINFVFRKNIIRKGMGRKGSNGGDWMRFNNAEVAEMEAILQAQQIQVPGREVLVALARNFSKAPERMGKVQVEIKQVRNWFQNRRYALRAKSVNFPQTSLMEFEARSSRDGAWYDVTCFLSHRSLETADPEALVRFAGFGPEEDEWVNVRKHVRQRSLPCESSECIAVLPGDLILCFQEGKEQALYFDAHVFDSQRRRHDARGCRCRFLVRYDHDQSEEIVPLRKICRRPETDYRLQQVHAEAAKVYQQRAGTVMYSSNPGKGHAPAETTIEQIKVDARAGSTGSQTVGDLKLSTHSPSGNIPKVNLSSETQNLPHTTKTPVGIVGTQMLPAPECHVAAATPTQTSRGDPGESNEWFEATKPQYSAETHADTTVTTPMAPTEEGPEAAVATSVCTQISLPKRSESEVLSEATLPQLSGDTQMLPATEGHGAVLTSATPSQGSLMKPSESEVSLEMSPPQDATEPRTDTVATQVLPTIELHETGVGAGTLTQISLPEPNESEVLLETSQLPRSEETPEDMNMSPSER